jgi:hypothetical protein
VDRDPLDELEALLERDWENPRQSQIQIQVNPVPTLPNRSLFPPQLDPKSPVTRWAMTIALALAAIAGALKWTLDLLGLV